MGHAVGREFRASGLEVLTCLSGRSPRTRRLAGSAGFRDLPSLETLAEQADLILSILVPEAAVALAEEVARAMKSTGGHPVFADCNAVSPATSRRIGSIICEAGGHYLDASIIGPPPGKGQPPRFYVSGSNAAVLSQLDGRGIAVKWIGSDIGRASAIKMCYAGLTKGTLALHAAVLTSAEALGLSEELRSELAYSQGQALKAMEQVKRVPAKAFRWIRGNGGDCPDLRERRRRLGDPLRGGRGFQDGCGKRPGQGANRDHGSKSDAPADRIRAGREFEADALTTAWTPAPVDGLVTLFPWGNP